MKQRFESIEQQLRQTSAELIGQMAEIQMLRLSVIRAESRKSCGSSSRGQKIERGLNQPPLELA